MKRFWVCFMAVSVVCTSAPKEIRAAAQASIRILPLKVFSEEPEAEELRTVLEGFMAARLMAEGELRVVHSPEESAPPEGFTQDQALQLGRTVDVQWVLWGSVTQIGRLLSLDLRLLDVREAGEPISLYAQAMNRDELLAQSEKEIDKVLTSVLGLKEVVEIRVEGNRRIGKDAILLRTKTRVGDGYSAYRLKEDIREIDQMGYFEDVQVSTEDVPEGKVVIFRVSEKPTLREIVVTGNKEIDTEDIEEVITLQPQSIINYEVLSDTVEKIKKLYQEKGYYAAEVTYDLKDLEGNQKALIFHIQEGKKFWVKKITFEGNKYVSDKKLKKAMETKEKDWLHLLTNSGVLDKETLNQDVERLAAYYYDHGFLKAQIGTPRIETGEGWIYITIAVSEGEPFTVSSVQFQGDVLLEEQILRKLMEVKEGDPFNRDALRKDIMRLTDVYADMGYAYAEINPDSDINDQEKTIGIILNFKKNQKVYIGRVRILGNTKTRDKVIRRELVLSEGDTFSSTALKNCTERLKAMDYFEEVNVTSTPGAKEDIVDLNVEVKEKQTGSFSLGAGYSTVDGIVGVGEIQQNNLFGRGYKVRLKAEIGQKRQFFDLGFLDPWFLDTRWSMRTDAYNLEREYVEYTRAALGGNLMFTHPLDMILRGMYGTIGYRIEDVEVKDVDEQAAEIYKLSEGRFLTSELIGALVYDTRNNPLYPSRGTYTDLTGFFAGLGGDSEFVKGILSSAYYIPFKWGTVFMARGEIGYGVGYGGTDLPVYERFFLGGINTLRGFEAGEVGPIDPETGQVVGGDKELFFNFEYIFPIVKKLELRGVVFYDTGNAFLGDIDISEFRQDVGVGVRWYSPFGPIRVEIGWNVDPLPGEDDFQWGFGMGGSLD
jgi:outer membrane protein insertion porin family